MIEIEFSRERQPADITVVGWADGDSFAADINVNEALLRANRGEFGKVSDGVDCNGKPIWIAGLGKRQGLTPLRFEQIGGHIVRHGLTSGTESACLDLKDLGGEPTDVAVRVAVGAAMASYRFDRYRAKSVEAKPNQKPTLKRLVMVTPNATVAEASWNARRGALEGTFLARDLVNEPPNVLTPLEFARRIITLASAGLDVRLLTHRQCEELGMGAFACVGRGSAQESVLAIIQWNGGKKADAPVAFVGKGVTFDTGGISIKPADGMQEMKADMGGAAAIAGAMLSLATRKAAANVVAVLGLAENMPSGDAYRPGDIVTSMSGQTIEITNTDAEGRLVLCDAMHYAQQQFTPRALIDVATLTGAAMVALGYTHAAIFSNSDALADAVEAAGRDEFERVWRLPLDPAYDAAMDSKVADMKNGAGRLGGAITAAQFLQRFVVNETPWVHIDMGGAVQTPSGDFKNEDPRTPSWATGWGVRLLDRLVRDHFEGGNPT